MAARHAPRLPHYDDRAYLQELIRHVDPARRTLGRFFHDEIAGPLGLEFYIGLPPEIPGERLAVLKTLSRRRAVKALRTTPLPILMKTVMPGSLLRRTMLLMNLDWNDRHSLEIELPAGNGVGTARAMAGAYSSFAEGGAEIGITPQTFARVTAPPEVVGQLDEVLGVPSYFTLGFLRPGPDVWFGARRHCATPCTARSRDSTSGPRVEISLPTPAHRDPCRRHVERVSLPRRSQLADGALQCHSINPGRRGAGLLARSVLIASSCAGLASP